VFPNTSFAGPPTPFFGFKLEDMSDFSVGFKLGVMYKPNDRLTLGAAYNNKVKLDFEGRMKTNLSALGLGTVTYRDAEAKNIDQPQEFGIGAAVKATDKLLLAVELNWIDWSDAVTTGIITASNPDNPAAPPTLKSAIDNNWRDQYVIATGMAYEWSDRTIFRAGYNYGRNPIPNDHLNPLLNTIAVNHLTLGFGHAFSNAWRIDGAFEWDLRNKEEYTNPQLPFGQDAEEVGELFALYFHVSRHW
jgi:long-chain fatty acid transport protein